MKENHVAMENSQEAKIILSLDEKTTGWSKLKATRQKKEGEEENILHYLWQNFTGNVSKTIALNQVKINIVENLRGLSLRKKIQLMILIDVSVFLYIVFTCICI